MSWLNKLTDIVLRRSKSSPTKVADAEQDMMPQVDSRLINSRILHRTRQITVATGIDMVASACAEADLKIWYGETEIPDHPFLDLLLDPNPHQTWHDLALQLFAMRELHGTAYWFLGSTDGKYPTEIWSLRPERVRVVPSRTRVIGEYIYDLGSYSLPLDPSAVVPFGSLTGKSDWYSDGKIDAALTEIATEALMANHQFAFFNENVTIPAGTWILPADLPDDKYAEAKEHLRAEHGGKRRTAVVRAGVDGIAPTFIRTGLDAKEMDFIASRAFLRKVIFERLGIPSGMLSEASTEAHARVAERLFLNNIWTRLVSVAAKHTKEILPFYGSGFIAKYRDVRTGDNSQILDKAKASAGLMTSDERRDYLFGYGPLTEEQRKELYSGTAVTTSTATPQSD